MLTERYYSWDEARKIARDDPEVDLSGEGPAYVMPDMFEEDIAAEAEEELLEAPETPSQKKEARPATAI